MFFNINFETERDIKVRAFDAMMKMALSDADDKYKNIAISTIFAEAINQIRGEYK